MAAAAAAALGKRRQAERCGKQAETSRRTKNSRLHFAAILKTLAFHLSETHIESPKNLPKRGLSFRGVLRFAEAKLKLYRPFPAFSFFTYLRSLRQFAAPHLASARHSASAKTLHTRGDAGCTKAASSGRRVCSLTR